VDLGFNLGQGASTGGLSYKGLQLYHNYKTDATDKSPKKSNHGVMYTGRSLAFDGSNDYVDLGDEASLTSPANLTFVTWVKNSDTAQSDKAIVGCVVGGGWQIAYQSTGQYKFRIRTDNAGSTYTASSGVYLDNSWHKIVTTFEGTQQKIYVDGVLDDTNDITATIEPPQQNIYLGADAASTASQGQHFNGELSNVQIWDKAWTAEDVAYDYANVQATPNDIANASSTLTIADNKAWLSADEGAGTTLYDGSSNDNNGAITGATWQTARVGQPSPKELITNGGFDDDFTGWQTQAGWTASSGQAVCDSSTNVHIIQTPLVNGKTYEISFEVLSITSGSFKVYMNNPSFGEFYEADTTGYHSFEHTYGGTDGIAYFFGVNTPSLTVDNISIKDVTNGIPQTGLMSYNKPMLFDGVNDAVETEIMNPMAEFTISASFDIKHNASNAYSALIDGGWWGVAPKFWVNIVNNNLFVEGFKTGSSTRWTLREDNVSDGLHHFSATYSSSALKLYLDGVEVDSIAGQSLTSISTVSPIQIGSMSISPSSNSFDGYINEVSIFDTALTADEVSELYNNGTALDATTHSKVDNLQGYWRNDGDDVWVDRSGNNNDGTVNGSPEMVEIHSASLLTTSITAT